MSHFFINCKFIYGKTITFNKKYPPATSVFNKWAEKGKDEPMAVGHANSVNFMFDKLESYFNNVFSVLDVGCGNGWVVRKFKTIKNCKSSVGIDGAKKMIEKAKKIDNKNSYICEDFLSWQPNQKFNIIHSMEVLYYLEYPIEFLKTIYEDWLNSSGCFIFGIDHYLENKPSLCWPQNVGVNMNTQSMEFWINAMKISGFRNIQFWQVGSKDDWQGTLVVFGQK